VRIETLGGAKQYAKNTSGRLNGPKNS